MTETREIPPTSHFPRSLSSSTVTRIGNSPPPGNVNPGRCHHKIKVYCCDQKKLVCINCGLREYRTLKIRASGTNLPDSNAVGDVVGFRPPRRNDN